jgi:hypothetical protein
MKRWVLAAVVLLAPVARAEPASDAGADGEAESRASTSQVDARIRQHLREGRYEFCRDRGYRIDPAEFELCSFADAAADRCPAFAEACRNAKAQPVREPSTPYEMRAPSGLAQVLFWGILLGGLAVLAVWLVRMAATRRRETEAAMPNAPPPDEPSSVATAPRITDVDRLLELARASAATGHSAEAIVLTHAALLRHLDHQGLLRLESTVTNGEYVRALAEYPEFEAVLRSVTVAVDRIQFGAWTGTGEAFRALFERVVAMVRVAAVIGFGCLVFGIATACSSEIGDRAASRDTSPDGNALLRQVLADHGMKSHRRVRELDAVPDEVGTVVVLAPQSEQGWNVLLDWTKRGGTLLLAGEMPPGRKVGARPSPLGCAAPHAISDKAGIGRVAVGGPRNATLTIDGSDAWTVIECGDRPYLVAQDLDDGRVLMLPDDQFLTNASLLVADNAWVLLSLLEGNEGDVELIDRWTGAAATTPFRAVEQGRLTPVVAQLLLLLAIGALWRGVAFGTPRDPPAGSRRSFAEHVRALGLAYAKVRATRLALASYGAWALDRLRERTQPGHGASLEALALAVAARTGRSEAEVQAILERTRIALDDPQPTATSWQDLTTMRELESLVSATGVYR